jgi:hypothetical protein
MMMTDMTDLFIYLPRVMPHSVSASLVRQTVTTVIDKLGLGGSTLSAVTVQQERRQGIAATHRKNGCPTATASDDVPINRNTLRVDISNKYVQGGPSGMRSGWTVYLFGADAA